MGNLMSKHDSQRSLVLRDRQQTLVNHNQSARHTPGVGLLIGHQIKLPLVVLYIVLHAISIQIAYHSISQILTYTLNHCGFGGIGRELGCFHKLLILLG